MNRRYRNAYELWCQRTGRRPSEKPELSEWTKFNIDTHIEQYRHWKNFLKKLGVTVPVSDISTGSLLALALARNTFDYTDNHWYHDHPNLGKPPYRYSDDSTLLNYQDLPLRAIAQRIFGKPMMLTEWHYCAPNSYRAEGGIASGAYCALQGINGIFDFCTLDYSRELGSQMNPKRRRLTGPFTVLDDPINRLNNYVVALLYGRGDVQEASQCFSLNISSTIWNNTNLLQYISWGADGKKALPQPEFIALGLIGKIGCTITTRKGDDRTNFTNDELLKQKNSRKNIASGVARVLNQLGLMQNGTAVSSTKEIRLTPADKQLTVITSRSEGLVQAKASNSGKVLSVRNNSVFSAIFAGSIDNRPLQESRRILLLHLTDVKGEYAKITTKDAFWEVENVTIYDSELNGEYLGWHSRNLRLVNCRISGEQPLCYAHDLILENCTFDPSCDRAFEYSTLRADVRGSITNIKNPTSGVIVADHIGSVTIDENIKEPANCIIKERNK